MAQKKQQQSTVDAELFDSSPQAADIEQPGPSTTEEQEIQSLSFERTRSIARKVWQASLGAAVTVEHRTINYFNHLVEKGAHFQHHADKNSSTEGNIQPEKTGESRSATLRAVNKIHDIEHSIEHGLDKGRMNTLHWIGISSRNELSALNSKVDELTLEVKALREKLHQQADAEGGEKSNKSEVA